jgi:hypothetical protein
MKIRDLDLSNNPINAEHAELGLPPVENQLTHPASHPVLRVAMWSVVFLLMGLTIALATRLFNQPDGHTGMQLIVSALDSPQFWSALLVGMYQQDTPTSTASSSTAARRGSSATSFERHLRGELLRADDETSARCACRTAGTCSAMRRCCAWPCPTAS